jgi:hypothetical protein
MLLGSEAVEKLTRRVRESFLEVFFGTIWFAPPTIEALCLLVPDSKEESSQGTDTTEISQPHSWNSQEKEYELEKIHLNHLT